VQRARPPHPITVLALLLLPCPGALSAAGAQEPEGQGEAKRIESLEGQLESLRVELESLKERLDSGERGTDPSSGGGVETRPFFERDPVSRRPLRDVYDKPFLLDLWRRAHVGGYFELEFHGYENEIRQIPRGFRLHRTNLFVFADIADNLRFASEIEFEYEAPGEDLETNVEMAFIDWILYRELVFRAGALLAPLGRVNLDHDGPTRELTDRPMVSTFVIPTTLTDPGVGFHGTFSLGDRLGAGYQIYATNGFDILDDQGNLATPFTERERLLQEGKPSNGGDSNKSVSTMGRLSLTGSLGEKQDEKDETTSYEVGFSWHVGNYDERNRNLLAILAGDFAVLHGPLSLEGEVARASFERDAFSRASGVPDNYSGFYVQAAWSFLPESLPRRAPHVFGNPGSAFTAVVRYDFVDLDGDRASALEPGINFRPFGDTVFKFSYRFGWLEFNALDTPALRDSDSSGFSFSVSSYF
jgi:hypothetical protein